MMTIPADPDPDQVTDTLNQSRAFATVTVPSAGLPNIVTIASLSRQTRLMLASADGYFYIYNIPEEGGDCVMVKQHRVDPECSEVAAAGQPSLTPPDSPAVIPVTQVGGASGGVYSVSTVQYSKVQYSTVQCSTCPDHYILTSAGGTLPMPRRVSSPHCAESRVMVNNQNTQ